MAEPTIAITGGPGAGKTTVLKKIPLLRGDLVLTMPEVASILLDGGFPTPRTLTDIERWSTHFQNAVFPVQLNMENEFIERARQTQARVVVFDRGLLDGAAYWGKEPSEFLAHFNFNEQEIYNRYDMVIHLESLAVSNPDLYETIKSSNPARYETAAEAAHRDETIKEAWRHHPNRIIVSGADGIETVTDKVMRLIDTYLTVEIERKYLLTTLPTVPIPPGVSIRQGYLDLETEVRIREIDDRHYMTIKSDGGLSRSECEVVINRTAFELLWKDTTGRQIFKTRCYIPYANHCLELDIYHQALKGLITMECEFKTQAEANSFVLPSWASAAKDITEQNRFKNRSLAVHGIPQ